MNDAVRYFEMDKRRDPTQVRTEWILTQLLRRPHGSDELKRLAEGNGFGYAPSTYTKDLTGLVKRRLVNPPARTGGSYQIDSRDGMAYARMRGLCWCRTN
jgi:hypothetical protein